MRTTRGNYPCRVCGRVLRSPGALGGHMSQHRRLGDLDRETAVTRAPAGVADGAIGPDSP